MKFKIILIILVCVLSGVVGWLVCDYFSKPETIIEIRTEYKDVDSVNIMQSARHGYIRYDRKRLISEFGSIYKDTLLSVKDSLRIIDSLNVVDSIAVAYMRADTTLIFTRYSPTDSIYAEIKLKQWAFWYPLYCFSDTLSIVNFKHTFIYTQPQQPFYKKNWFWGIVGVGGGLLIGGAK